MSIQRSGRIRVRNGVTIYCTHWIQSLVKEHCVRLKGNEMVPRKDHTDALRSQLTDLCHEHPEQFTQASREFLVPSYRRSAQIAY
jgi:hypothetical protein